MELCCNSLQLSDYRSLTELILYTQKNQYTASDHGFISKALKILRGVSLFFKDVQARRCMVFPTLYIEHTAIMYGVSIKSHFPSCDSNYDAADLCEANKTKLIKRWFNQQCKICNSVGQKELTSFPLSSTVIGFSTTTVTFWGWDLGCRIENKKVINHSKFQERLVKTLNFIDKDLQQK